MGEVPMAFVSHAAIATMGRLDPVRRPGCQV